MTTWGAPACFAATAASKAALPPPTTTTAMFSALMVPVYLTIKIRNPNLEMRNKPKFMRAKCKFETGRLRFFLQLPIRICFELRFSNFGF
jgi:hypothetical protein